VLVHLLEWSGRELTDFLRTLDPLGPARFPLAWAGEDESLTWFDVAREYTEKWHHSQQLFEAVHKPSPLLGCRLYHPVLETFLRALPFTFRGLERPDGTAVRVVVEGEAGGEWWLLRQDGSWVQVATTFVLPAASVWLPQGVAWKVWTKRREVEAKVRDFPGIRMKGDADLARRVVGMVAVMA
jgi:hypothetical protein